MTPQTPNRAADLGPPVRESVWTLIVALILLGAIVASVMSCGTEDLTFPGQIPFTDTPGNTATPTATPVL